MNNITLKSKEFSTKPEHFWEDLKGAYLPCRKYFSDECVANGEFETPRVAGTGSSRSGGRYGARPSNEVQPHARDPILRRKLPERTGFRDEDSSIHNKATGYFTFFLPTYLLVATLENLTSKVGCSSLASGMVVLTKKP